MEWKPIATAPKDETRVILFRDGWEENMAICTYMKSINEWIAVGGCVFNGPTYWMPLPESPKD